MIIINSIWLLFRNKKISLFVTIIFLVLNIAAGGGTFSPMYQNSFFQFIAYIVPFTFAIKGQGAIIFGIGGDFNVLKNYLYVIEMCV
jgi:uncharacterized phage infection (PIP) family protein YhgE